MQFRMLSFLMVLTLPASSQVLTFKAQQDLHGNNYANIWGYTAPDGREYALLGCQTGTAIVDVTDPSNPQEITFITGANSSWHEIQVWDHYAYVVSEGGRGVQIIDLSNLPAGATLVTEWTTPSYNRTHDIQIRDGFAYLTGGNTTASGGIKILNLANPVAPVEVGNFDLTYVHDCYVRNDTIYAAAINEGRVYIIDARDKSNLKVVHNYNYPNGFTHNTALTDDGQYLFTTDETSSPPGRLLVWDISTLRDGIDGNTNITPVDTFASTAIVHNVFAKGRFGYASYYTEGVRVWDITNPASLNLLGQYDTYPSSNAASYNGAWGIYPYFPSGTIVVSDISGGLFVLNFSQAESGIVKGVVKNAGTGQPIAGAKIYLLQDNLTRSGSADGSFRIKALSGNSRFKIVRPGYDTLYRDVMIPVNDSVTVNFDLDQALPVPPSNVSITKDSATVMLKWFRTSTLDFKQYRIYGDTAANPAILLDSLSLITDTTYTVNGLTNGVRYYFRVTTVNQSGIESGPSSQVNAVPSPAPLNILAVVYQNPVVTSSVDVLVSTDVSLISSPAVRIWLGNDTTNIVMNGVGSSTTNYVGSYTLLQSGTYTVNVKAKSIRFVDSTKNRVFTVLLAKPGLSNTLVSSDRIATLHVGSRAVSKKSFFTAIVGSEAGASVYTFGPMAMVVGDTRLTMKAPDADVQSWFLEQRINGVWSRVPGQFVAGTEVSADVLTLGEFRLIKVSGEENKVVKSVVLEQNYPNPFNPTTTITYEIPLTQNVRLEVYNLLGQKIKVLVDGKKPAGVYEVVWDGRNQKGQAVASGVYFYRLFTGGTVTTRKMLIVK